MFLLSELMEIANNLFDLPQTLLSFPIQALEFFFERSVDNQISPQVKPGGSKFFAYLIVSKQFKTR